MPPAQRKPSRSDNSQAAAIAKTLFQKLHLVSENAPVGQEQVLGAIRFEGHGQKRHVGLLGTARSLAVVAGLAGGNHVAPAVFATLGQGPDVIPGQHVLR